MASSGGGEGQKEAPPIRSTSLGMKSGTSGGGGGAGGTGGGTVRRGVIEGSGGSSHSLSLPKENHSGGRRRTEASHSQISTPSGGGIHSAGGGRRPVKIWNASRTIRKALVVSTYEEFHRKGREKLGLGKSEPVRVVLETDGTQVDDGEYFQTLQENSIFLFLRSGEVWHPAGTDAVRAVMEAIPSIVCDTLYSMGLHDQVPSWKIMDSKGRITVVLQWEKEPGVVALAALAHGGGNLPSRQSSLGSTIASGGPRLLNVHTRSISQRSGSSVSSTPCLSRDNSRTAAGGATTAIQHHMLVQTSFDSSLPGATFGPHITVINHDAGNVKVAGTGGSGGPCSSSYLGPPSRGLITGAPSPRQLSRQGSSVESTTIVPIHHHTAECAGAGRGVHQPTQNSKRGSPTSTECDFHCCSLHTGPPIPGGAQAQGAQKGFVHAQHQHHHHHPPPLPPHGTSHKTVATSPIQSDGGGDGKRSLSKGAHVRFSEINEGSATTALAGPHGPGNDISTTASAIRTPKCSTATTIMSTSATTNGLVTSTTATSVACLSILEPTLRRGGSNSAQIEGNESSESETENNDEIDTARKFLLLVDQLGMDQPHHLSIKDIGVILERLSAKIIDVERLERELEGPDTHNWTIKATIRGEAMRELGVIYNSNYYSISEHPGYQSNLVENEEEEEDEEDENGDEEDDRTTDDTTDRSLIQ